MTYIKQEFDFEKDPTGIMSMSFITETVVTIFSGTISDLVGRRPMLITSSIMFLIGGLVNVLKPSTVITPPKELGAVTLEEGSNSKD
ncbi:MFS transporter [Medicago truncatula]|uniref:MFS transporter n=1 Tax=Medicago truncatula TaxID=3880 RepID=G7KAY7_MEDTR|nr:MFS transporter [Medicago truncatula]